jgi:putative ABC transport system permease protein
MLSSLLPDARVALRGLMRSPAFTTVTVLTLSVAIGAITAIFSVLDAVVLKPLPYTDPDRIVTVAAATLPQAGGGADGLAPFSDRGYWHFVNQSRSYEKFGGFEGGNPQWPLTGDGPPLQVDVSLMTVEAFEVLGTRPERGRWPTAEEAAPDGPKVALLSHELWTNRYGQDPAMVGKTIELNGTSWEVIAIMPASFDFPAPEVDLWVPDQLNPASENFGGHHISAIARLTPTATLASAASEGDALIGRFSEVGYGPEWFQTIFSGKSVVRPLKDNIVGDARRPLWIIFGTVAFVLLIACSNVANLLLVRAEGRTRETAVRLALGSSRGRLVQYVLAESLMLSLIGGLLGVLLAWLGTRTLVAMAPASIPRLGEIGIRGGALAFTAGVAILSGLFFGLLPALRAGSKRSFGALRDGGRGSTVGRDRHHARAVLVIGQVALALVLLVGSGLMVRSFQRLRAVDPGFRSEDLLTFRLAPPPSKYPNGEATARFYDQLIERLEGLPGVVSAGGISTLPLTGGGPILTTVIDEFPPAEGEFPPVFFIRRATPGYFETMGIPIVEGREFTSDDHNARLGTLLISKSVKDRYWPQATALDKRMTTAGAPARSVGVVGDVHHEGLSTPAEQFIYKPMLDSVQGAVRAMAMVVRTQGDPTTLAPAVRAAVEALDPDLPITDLRAMDDVVADSLSRTTFTMSLLALSALVALFLGSVGIYGVLSYVATQRTAEMGLRLALGADAGIVRTIILRQGMLLAGTGVAIGVLGALALGGVLDTLLYDVQATDPLILVGGSVAFLLVALGASLIPAQRAARTAPAVALRSD